MKRTKNGTFSFNIVRNWQVSKHEVIDHPWMNSFSFWININKLLVNHCVDELEQIKALCDVIAMLWYIPNRNYQSIAMTSHNVLVCSNSSIQCLTSNLLIWIRKLKLFIHGWSITSCFETCQLRTILKLNVPFLVDFITWNYKNASIKRILMRLNRFYYHNTCWMLIAVTIWNVPEHCNDVTQCFDLFQFVDTMINK